MHSVNEHTGIASWDTIAPPQFPTIYILKFTLELHTVLQQLCAVMSSNILHSVTAAAVI